ncbi:hypothetical protein D3C77_399100 [compost metagenome]
MNRLIIDLSIHVVRLHQYQFALRSKNDRLRLFFISDIRINHRLNHRKRKLQPFPAIQSGQIHHFACHKNRLFNFTFPVGIGMLPTWQKLRRRPVCTGRKQYKYHEPLESSSAPASRTSRSSIFQSKVPPSIDNSCDAASSYGLEKTKT